MPAMGWHSTFRLLLLLLCVCVFWHVKIACKLAVQWTAAAVSPIAISVHTWSKKKEDGYKRHCRINHFNYGCYKLHELLTDRNDDVIDHEVD